MPHLPREQVRDLRGIYNARRERRAGRVERAGRASRTALLLGEFGRQGEPRELPEEAAEPRLLELPPEVAELQLELRLR